MTTVTVAREETLCGCRTCPPGSVSSRFCDDHLREVLRGCVAGDVEYWVEHPVFADYWVSSFGRVKSRYRVLKGTPDAGGSGEYLTVGVGGKRRRVHHLVLESYIGQRPAGLEACHWDDDKTNNKVFNLRWDDHLANYQDLVRNRRAWWQK
jgi:HNH endonuclease